MLKHYVEFFYLSSIIPHPICQEIETRTHPIKLPEGAYAYRYFSREEIEHEGETLYGEKKDYSPKTYYGEILTLEQIKALPGNHWILISNMKSNGWDKIVKTICGNIQPLKKGDIVISI